MKNKGHYFLLFMSAFLALFSVPVFSDPADHLKAVVADSDKCTHSDIGRHIEHGVLVADLFRCKYHIDLGEGSSICQYYLTHLHGKVLKCNLDEDRVLYLACGKGSDEKARWNIHHGIFICCEGPRKQFLPYRSGIHC